MNIFMGIMWLSFGIFWIMSGKDDASSLYDFGNWLGVACILLSACYFIMFINQVRNHYLTIDDGFIKQNWPYGKEMKLEEIKQNKNSDDKYILQSELQKMKINLKLIDDKSIIDLKSELMKLGIKWEWE